MSNLAAAMAGHGEGDMESCAKHPHEIGVALCGRCGFAWCDACLVFAHGPDKAPLCMECAMFAGGVRSAATRPALSRREMKARVKQVQAAMAAKADPVPASTAAVESEPDVAAPPPPVADWSTPWWEDRQPTLAD